MTCSHDEVISLSNVWPEIAGFDDIISPSPTSFLKRRRKLNQKLDLNAADDLPFPFADDEVDDPGYFGESDDGECNDVHLEEWNEGEPLIVYFVRKGLLPEEDKPYFGDDARDRPYGWAIDNDDDSDDEEQYPVEVPYTRGDFDYFTPCCICLREMPVFTRPCCSAGVCDRCMDEYVERKVTDDGVTRVACPCCNDFVQRDEVLFRLKGEAKDKFYRYLNQSNSTPFKKLCPRCSFVTEVEDGTKFSKNGLRTECESCSFVWCFPCHAPYHADMSCKAYQKGSKPLMNWAKSKRSDEIYQYARHCPKCKVLIERADGCNHVECSQCKTEFCFFCGNTFREIKFVGGHEKKFSIFGCSYYLFEGRLPVLRKTIRGTLLGGKILLWTLGLPFLGGYKVGKFGYKRTKHAIWKIKFRRHNGNEDDDHDDYRLDDDEDYRHMNNVVNLGQQRINALFRKLRYARPPNDRRAQSISAGPQDVELDLPVFRSLPGDFRDSPGSLNDLHSVPLTDVDTKDSPMICSTSAILSKDSPCPVAEEGPTKAERNSTNREPPTFQLESFSDLSQRTLADKMTVFQEVFSQFAEKFDGKFGELGIHYLFRSLGLHRTTYQEDYMLVEANPPFSL